MKTFEHFHTKWDLWATQVILHSLIFVNFQFKLRKPNSFHQIAVADAGFPRRGTSAPRWWLWPIIWPKLTRKLHERGQECFRLITSMRFDIFLSILSSTTYHVLFLFGEQVLSVNTVEAEEVVDGYVLGHWLPDHVNVERDVFGISEQNRMNIIKHDIKFCL